MIAGANFWTPDETLLELLTRKRSQPVCFGVAAIDAAAPGGFHPGDAIEITGPSDSGKTLLLLAFAARLATEDARGSARVNVVYLDMDGRAPLVQLANLIRRELASAGAPASEARVLEHMSRVSLCYCPTPLKLLAALARERQRLADLPADRRLAVLVDGLGASIWADKAEFAHTRRAAGHPYDRLAQLLLELARPQRALLAVGTREVFDVRKDGVAPALARATRVRVQARAARGGRRIEVRVGAARPRQAAGAPQARHPAGAAGDACAMEREPWVGVELCAGAGAS